MTEMEGMANWGAGVGVQWGAGNVMHCFPCPQELSCGVYRSPIFQQSPEDSDVWCFSLWSIHYSHKYLQWVPLCKKSKGLEQGHMGEWPQKDKEPPNPFLVSSPAHQIDFQMKIHLFDLSNEAHMFLRWQKLSWMSIRVGFFLRAWSQSLQYNKKVIRIIIMTW